MLALIDSPQPFLEMIYMEVVLSWQGLSTFGGLQYLGSTGEFTIIHRLAQGLA